MDFEVNQADHILVGKDFDIVYKMQNKSRHERNVHTSITLSTVYYTGVPKATVVTKTFDTLVPCIQGKFKLHKKKFREI